MCHLFETRYQTTTTDIGTTTSRKNYSLFRVWQSGCWLCRPIADGHVRKPTIVKAYIGIFVSLSVKAVHLELVTDLTSDAFIACLRRFIARRGLPTLIWSDNGTNFVGASRQLKEVHDFLKTNTNHEAVCNYLSTQKVEWRFIPQRAPHFGGIWEAAVKSVKTQLRKILGEVKLTYE